MAKSEDVQKAHDDAFAAAQQTCPHCGYCPHCGRADTKPYLMPYPVPYPVPAPQPVYPWQPTWISQPNRITCGGGTGSGSVTVNGAGAVMRATGTMH